MENQSQWTQNKGYIKWGILVITILSILGIVFSNIFTVDSKEVGVIKKFGKVQIDDIKTAGLNFKTPFITTVEKVVIATKMINCNGSDDKPDTTDAINMPALTVLTAQSLSIPIDVTIQYRIDANKVGNMVATKGSDGVWEHKTIVPAIRSAVRDSIGTVSFDELNTKRTQYEEAMKLSLIKDVSKDGIIIEGVAIKNIGMPKVIADAVLSKEAAKQNAERAKYQVEQAKQEAEIEIQKAKGIATANNELAQSINSNLIEFKKLEIEMAKVNKWDGQNSNTLMISDGKAPSTMVQVK